MGERYLINDAEEPMLHLAERNLLLKILQDRLRFYYEERKVRQGILCEVKLTLCRHWNDREADKMAFEMSMQNEDVGEFQRQLMEQWRIGVRGGEIILVICVRGSADLSQTEINFLKCLVVDVAETLKLFAGGDCFLKLSVEKLIAEIVSETGMQDPTAWTRAYLEPPKYMQRPEVRRYYRLRRFCLDNAKPQQLLYRKPEELVEASCRGGVPI